MKTLPYNTPDSTSLHYIHDIHACISTDSKTVGQPDGRLVSRYMIETENW